MAGAEKRIFQLVAVGGTAYPQKDDKVLKMRSI
jgi:hypothetical protein